MIKTLFFLATFVNCTLTYAQSGSNCDSAVLLTSSQSCNYTQFTTSGPTMWFKFVATSENILVSIVTTQYGSNLPHIHNLGLYQGTCNQLMFEVEKDLPFIDSNDVLSLPLLSYGLQIGQTYYLKAERISHIGACDKVNCLNNQSTDPATFDICVQGIDIIIPPNSTELPSKHHTYEENLGQLKDFNSDPVTDIKAFCNKSIPQVYIADKYASLVWSKIDDDTTTLDTIQRVDLHFDKAKTPTFLPSEQITSYNNYYTTQSSQGLLGVKSFSRIIMNELYPKTDLHYYSNEDGVKLYFVIKQGGDPNNIVMQFMGADSTDTTSSGGLKINSLLGGLEFKKAAVYAIDNLGNFSALSASGTFLSHGGDEYSIEFEPYASNLNLIVVIEQEPQPQQLSGAEDLEWSTYLGGSGSDLADHIEADSDGNIYVVGHTASTNFPSNGTGVFSSSLTAFSTDGFLTKFSSDYELLWNTYFGGDREDVANGVARDNSNHVTYVCGGTYNGTATLAYTSQAYAANPNSYLDTYNPIPPFPELYAIRTFVSRFDDQGARQWSSFFINHNSTRYFSGLAVDNNSNLYLAATATMTNGQIGVASNQAQTNGDHPICYPNSNSYRQYYTGGTPGSDCFIMKFNENLELVWSTFLGTSALSDQIHDIEIDDDNNFLYVVGTSGGTGINSSPQCPTLNSSGSFPLCDAGAYFQDFPSGGFLSRFSLDGEINWSTYFANTVTGVDTHNGTVYITGQNEADYGPNICTENTDGSFPQCASGLSYFQSALAGNRDTYIASFRPTTQLTWSTLIGGTGGEPVGMMSRISANSNGNIHLYGTTNSRNTSATTSFPTLSNSNYYFKSTHSDYPASDITVTDTYVMTFSSSKQLLWSTYFGGKQTSTPPNTSNGDYNGGIIGLNDRVYICGSTRSNTLFPYHCPSTPNPYCKSSLSGNLDAFVAQLRIEGTSVGLNEESFNLFDRDDKLLVYPNPNSGEFTVKWNTSTVQNTEICILNQLGQTINSIEIKSSSGLNESKINCEKLAPGIYFVNVNNIDSSKTVKIIIQ